MSHVMGMALALAMVWNGTNGFDADHLLLLPGSYQVVATTEFLAWFRKNPDVNAEVMRYLVRCALAGGRTVKLEDQGRSWSWAGELGLAEPFGPLVDLDGKRGVRVVGKAAARPDVDKWISACILAHANVLASHQFISIRGNPRDAGGALVLPAPSPEERWTEGYPEGVFFGDLFDSPAQAPGDLNSFTVSLNLPDGYQDPTSGWRPPNAVLGRTLDFDRETRARTTNARIALRLGTYQENRNRFRGPAIARDPDYSADAVCAGDVADCSPAAAPPPAKVLRPLFVHLPRLANPESAHRADDPGLPFQVLDRGTAIDKAQVRACRYGTCVGPFRHLWAGGQVLHPAPRGEGQKLVNLKVGQILEPTLRFISKLEAKGVQVERGKAFTAIVRYACEEEACRALVRLQAADGTWSDAGDSWPSTGSPDRYEWLQVYPVYLPSKGEVALRIRIEGAKGPAPELDALGFLPGEPRCDPTLELSGRRGIPSMGVCRAR